MVDGDLKVSTKRRIKNLGDMLVKGELVSNSQAEDDTTFLDDYVDSPDTSCTVGNEQLSGLQCDQYGELIVQGGFQGYVYPGWKFTEGQTEGYMWVGLPISYAQVRIAASDGYLMYQYQKGEVKRYNLAWDPVHAGFTAFNPLGQTTLYSSGISLHLYLQDSISTTNPGFFRPTSSVTYFRGPIHSGDLTINGQYADITLSKFSQTQLQLPTMTSPADREVYLGAVDAAADGQPGLSKEDTLYSWAGWQMISNPYTSHLNICKFYNDNKANIRNSIYVVLRKAVSTNAGVQVKYRDTALYRLIDTKIDCSPNDVSAPSTAADWKKIVIEPFTSMFVQIKPAIGATDTVTVPLTISKSAQVFMNSSRTAPSDKFLMGSPSKGHTRSIVSTNLALSSTGLDKLQLSSGKAAPEVDLNQQIVQVSLVAGNGEVLHTVRAAAGKYPENPTDNARMLGAPNENTPMLYMTNSQGSRYEDRFVSNNAQAPVGVSTTNGSGLKLAFEIKNYVKGRNSTIPVFIFDKFTNEVHQLQNGESYSVDLPDNSDKLVGRYAVCFGKRPRIEASPAAKGGMIIGSSKGMLRVYVPRDEADHSIGGKTLISVRGLGSADGIYSHQFDNSSATPKRIQGVNYLGFELYLPSSPSYVNNLGKPVVVESRSGGVNYATKVTLK